MIEASIRCYRLGRLLLSKSLLLEQLRLLLGDEGRGNLDNLGRLESNT
jgi:hypothetical protein